MRQAAGTLRHKVTIKREGGTTFDSLGRVEPLEETVFIVWASIEPLRGQESMLARQLNATISHRVKLRWSSEVAAITPKEYWIQHGDRKLHILEVRNIDEDEHTLELICGERL